MRIRARLVGLCLLGVFSASRTTANKSPSRLVAQALRIVSLAQEPIFDTEGTPRQPYAMELTRINLKVKNAGTVMISKAEMLSKLPEVEAQDFSGDGRPDYAPNGGYWNPATSQGLLPGETAQFWMQGHFLSSGTKRMWGQAGADRKEASVEVLRNPGCLDAHSGESHYARGWAIGTTACADPRQCVTTTRQQDRCEGGKTLATFRCLPDPRGDSHVYYVPVTCSNGCRKGACLRRTIVDAQHSLKLISPRGGEKFQRGKTITVSWQSQGVAGVNFKLYSEKVHKRGGAHTVMSSLGYWPDPSLQPTLRSAPLVADLTPSDDWVLTILQQGEDPLISESEPFTVLP